MRIFVRVAVALVACASIYGTQPHLTAQTVSIEIPDQLTCPRCTVTLERVVRLGRESDTVDIRSTLSVARDSRGQFFLPMGRPATIGVFSSDGRFMRTVGRIGEGPGELSGVGNLAVGHGDTILAYNPARRFVALFSPAFTFVRSIASPARVRQMFVGASGRTTLLGEATTPEAIGFPLHSLNSSDSSWRSFGGTGRQIRPDLPVEEWLMGHANAEQFWLLKRTTYTLQLYDQNGRITKEIRRNSGWFPNRDADPESINNPRTIKPIPRLNFATTLPNGNVAVGFIMPVRNWRPTQGPLSAQGDTLLETMIEVIDPAAGKVIASGYVPAFIVGSVAPGLLFSMVDGPDGRKFVDIWRVGISQPGQNITNNAQQRPDKPFSGGNKSDEIQNAWKVSCDHRNCGGLHVGVPTSFGASGAHNVGGRSGLLQM